MTDSFTLLELAVMYTALQERCERLEQLYSQDNDVKLYGEIQSTKSALDKTKHIFISTGGKSDLLE